MKLYKATIKPLSYFTTPIKGDTLFGHLCWAISYRKGQDSLVRLLESYKGSRPFLVVSDGFPSGYVPKPTLPLSLFGEEDKKAARKKRWITIEELRKGNFHNAQTDDEVSNDKSFTIVRNSINYKTFTTSGENFAPYGVKEYSFSHKDIYILIDEMQIDTQDIKEALMLIGEMGYGKDSSVGKGKFEVNSWNEMNVSLSSKTYLALAPFCVSSEKIEKIYYEPFTRFGKFGGTRAHKNAFKKPILLMDSGATVIFKNKESRSFIGNAITDISRKYPDAVHQGYTILLPMKDIT